LPLPASDYPRFVRTAFASSGHGAAREGAAVIALLQRVTAASVDVSGERVAAIGGGLLVFVGVERDDRESNAARLSDRILSYRVFADAAGKMNRSVQDVSGALLIVPQFTLAADTAKGTRASFTSAAAPVDGRRLFDALVARVRASGLEVATGIFGAGMSVTLTNDGPVTFRLAT
jgi:D-tyrosyl-tRNA(Tyr) deacylase